MSDVRDILELGRVPSPEITKEMFLGPQKKKKNKVVETIKKPEGMHREVFALLRSDNKEAPPLFPTDTGKGYQMAKAKLGMRRVRPWKWMPFKNPARTDGVEFYHWRRIADEGKEYPFAKFNKKVQIGDYSDAEYDQHLKSSLWTKEETNHLFDLCRRFDARFTVVQDRWDREKFKKRTIEEIKDRYYDVGNTIAKINASIGEEPEPYIYDADHEARRKEQLRKLFDRTPEQVEEEQMLLNELRRIEARKKERERKTQDLQKLITAADSQLDSSLSTKTTEKKLTKRKLHPMSRLKSANVTLDSACINFPNLKTSGISLRSQRMKLPSSVGQKKLKAIEQLLQELGIEINPIPTEEIAENFNDLRSDMVLLYELKMALANSEFELQTLTHQHNALAPNASPLTSTSSSVADAEGETSLPSAITPTKTKNLADVIDLTGSPSTNRMRKTSVDNLNSVKKKTRAAEVTRLP